MPDRFYSTFQSPAQLLRSAARFQSTESTPSTTYIGSEVHVPSPIDRVTADSPRSGHKLTPRSAVSRNTPLFGLLHPLVPQPGTARHGTIMANRARVTLKALQVLGNSVLGLDMAGALHTAPREALLHITRKFMRHFIRKLTHPSES